MITGKHCNTGFQRGSVAGKKGNDRLALLIGTLLITSAFVGRTAHPASRREQRAGSGAREGRSHEGGALILGREIRAVWPAGNGSECGGFPNAYSCLWATLSSAQDRTKLAVRKRAGTPRGLSATPFGRSG